MRKNEVFDGVGGVISSVNAPYSSEEVKQGLQAYRDEYIKQQVSYTNGSDVTFTFLNTEVNRNWLAGLENRWKNKNSGTIKFKNVDGSRITASLADLQGLQAECFGREQAGRVAEDAVLSNHESEAYTDDSWKSDFDDAVETPISAISEDVAAKQVELLTKHDAVIARHYSQEQLNKPPIGSPNTVTPSLTNSELLEWLEWAQSVREANDSGTVAEQLAALAVLEANIPT